MADVKRTIEILFQGTNTVGTAITSVGRDMGKLNYHVSNVAQPFASLTTGVLKLDAALVAIAGAGIAYATKQFASFEDVMLSVKGIMQASDVEYTQLTDLTKELGATTRYTAAEAAEGLKFLAQAGFEFEDSMDALPTTLQLAQASATDLGSTADILTNIMAGYGIAIGDLAETSDVLTATFTGSNTNLTQLGQAFKYVGPVAKSLGLEIEETAALLGTLGNSGYQAEQGGTALRNILIALVAPAGNAGKLMKELGVDTSELGVDLASSAEALESLGVKVKNSTGGLRPFADIMDDLSAGLLKIQDPADRSAILIEIFGKRGGPQMAALLEQGSAAVTGLEGKIRGLGGITADIADEMESGAGGALRSLASAFESTAIAIGENIRDGVIGPIRGLTDVFRTLSLSVDEGMFDPVFSAFERFGEGLAEDLEDIAENLPEALGEIDFDGFLEALGSIGDEIGGLFDGLDFSQPEDLAKSIQRVIDTLESVVSFTSGVASVFIELAKHIGGLINSFNQLDSNTVATGAKIVGLGAAITAVAVPIATVTTAIKGLGGVITTIAGGSFVGIFAGVAAAASGVAIASNSVVEKLHEWIGTDEKLEEASRKAMAAVEADIEKIRGGYAGAAEDVEDFGESAYDANLKSIEAMDQSYGSAANLTEKMRELGILVEEKKTVNIDISEAVKNLQTLEYYRESTGTWETIMVPIDTTEVEAAKQKIEEIPAEKRLKFETDLQIAQVQAQAEIVQSSLKFQAARPSPPPPKRLPACSLIWRPSKVPGPKDGFWRTPCKNNLPLSA